jgi:hypothetical protein
LEPQLYGKLLPPNRGRRVLQGKNRERWMELCEQAAIEQDPEKLMQLVKQINDMLEAKEKRLADARKGEANK